MSYLKISNKIIECGIIFLIVFTPIAFGTVHPWAYTLMELTICFLIIIWIIRLAIINLKKRSKGKKRESSLIIPESLNPSIPKSSIVNRFGFIKTPLNIPIIIFIGLILFQLVPLPPGVLKIISPNTYQLYKATTPGWPANSNETLPIKNLSEPVGTGQRINESQNYQSSIPQSLNLSIPQSWRTISIYKYATTRELYKILAYIGIFFLIVNYNPSTRSRRPVTTEHKLKIKRFITSLIVTLIVIGCFESIYGLLEYLSGNQHIFFRQKAHHLESVTGTYLNRNHFVAYLSIVICMSFGYIVYISSNLSLSNVSKLRKKMSQMINIIGTREALLFFLILIMSTAVVLSCSRMGICSFITAIIIMSIMISKKISIKKMTLIVLPICLLAVWIGLNPVIKRFSDTSKDVKTEGSRIQVWKDTFSLIKDFPVLGTGLGTYEYAFPKYKTFKQQILYDHAHNDYIQLMSNTGITGFIIAIAGAAYYLFVIMKIWFKRKSHFVRCITVGCLGGITYIILHSFTDFNLQIPANALHLSVITGIMHKTITQL